MADLLVWTLGFPDEVYGAATDADLEAFLSRPEMVRGGRWSFVLGKSGGRQKTVVASRWGIRPELLMENLSYPEASLDSLGALFPEGRFLFNLEKEDDVRKYVIARTFKLKGQTYDHAG